MLQIKNITKKYSTGGFTQLALNGVSIDFREKEFVAILGPSGSGKTTFLNIIGGLDRYDSGDLLINGKSTEHFTSSDWDAYRNNSVGFVFQSYNLISHLSVLANVEMGMTLSGVPKAVRRKTAIEALDRVGLKDHINKKTNQLSGGQMQRVAIARALSNNPDIIMMDEPTGALDTATSIQIMELIKEIAKDKLVIMVTHNPELANEYANRIISFKDGNVIDDSNPYHHSDEFNTYQLKKTRMGFLTALNLSWRNIGTKKWRTAITAFASSLGIIGIALVLSLSNGFQIQVDKFQYETVTNMPIVISQMAMNVDKLTMNQFGSLSSDEEENLVNDKIFLFDPFENSILHANKITEDYLDYIYKIDPEICQMISFTRITNMNALRKTNNGIVPVTLSSSTPASKTGMTTAQTVQTYPVGINGDPSSYLSNNYDLLYGSYPQNDTDMVLVVNSSNKIDKSIIKSLGFDTDEIKYLDYTDLVGVEFKIIPNDDYYVKSPLGIYMRSNDFDKMYASPDSITVSICGIIKLKDDVQFGVLTEGVAVSNALIDKIVSTSKDSIIVKAQAESDNNVLSGEKLDASTKSMVLSYLGGDSTPYEIMLYPSTFRDKEALLSYLDKYNDDKSEEDAIVYIDMAEMISTLSGGIMDAITVVLIAFASISLVVSLIMIGIIIYISVLERTKEIGILRALGARKTDIARVFNAETFIIGLSSGLLGILIAYLLMIPTNNIIYNLSGLENVARLKPTYALALVLISLTLTLIGGSIPASIASKKDPVVALRTE